jgi:hypothetical protein
MNLSSDWQTAFTQAIRQNEVAYALKEAALNQRLGNWTVALTDVCVVSCRQLGWQVSAKGHELDLLPEARSEYLTLDVAAFAPSRSRWRFPVAVMELENSRRNDLIAYSLWKVLCVRASLRVVFCYRAAPDQAAHLIRFLQEDVVLSQAIDTRLSWDGETLVVVGGRSAAETFPYGFFKWWRLEKNTGVFETL